VSARQVKVGWTIEDRWRGEREKENEDANNSKAMIKSCDICEGQR
jgi:hypothetical protein